MLVLTRKIGEEVWLTVDGRRICRVVRIDKDSLGFEAVQEVKISRHGEPKVRRLTKKGNSA